MKHLFVPYEIAVIAKDAGFDEPCMYAFCEKGGWNSYTRKNEEITIVLKTDGNPFGEFFTGKNWNIKISDNKKSKIQCSAPLYQQLTDWLREKHKIHCSIFAMFESEDSYKTCWGWNALELEWGDDKEHHIAASCRTSDRNLSYYEAYNTALIEVFKLISK